MPRRFEKEGVAALGVGATQKIFGGGGATQKILRRSCSSSAAAPPLSRAGSPFWYLAAAGLNTVMLSQCDELHLSLMLRLECTHFFCFAALKVLYRQVFRRFELVYHLQSNNITDNNQIRITDKNSPFFLLDIF